MRVAEAEIRQFGLNPADVILAQGTLRPDLIESASKLASKCTCEIPPSPTTHPHCSPTTQFW